jgi:hypothetical protein
MTTTISGDNETANLNGGPYWANNLTWNIGNLVNGTDFTESITMDNPNSPNNGTTISWNFPNTPATFNVYSYPEIGYGPSGGHEPATSVTPEQIGNINTLTLSNNITLSGNTDQYDVIYDTFLTSAPGGFSAPTHEIEVYLHTPSYSQYFNNVPHQNFTDANGVQWTIAEPNSSQVLFAPTNYQDMTNATIDLKAMLQAAVADGVLSGNEYFDGLGLGAEPQQGSGSITINSYSVNYDGDPNHTTSSTGGTQTGSSSTTTSSTAANDPAPAQSQTAATNPPSDTTSTAASDTAQNQTAATNPSSDTTSTAASDTTQNQTAATNPSSDTTSAPVTNSSPTTGTDQVTSSNPHHHNHGASFAHEHASGGGGAAASNGSGGNNFHDDIATLLQALQQNNTNAVNNAVTALGNDVHAASAADPGSAPSSTDHHFEHYTHHFEHMWG